MQDGAFAFPGREAPQGVANFGSQKNPFGSMQWVRRAIRCRRCVGQRNQPPLSPVHVFGPIAKYAMTERHQPLAIRRKPCEFTRCYVADEIANEILRLPAHIREECASCRPKKAGVVMSEENACAALRSKSVNLFGCPHA
jgi:hypothetical protein